MDKRCVIKFLISGVILHLVVIAFYVTTTRHTNTLVSLIGRNDDETMQNIGGTEHRPEDILRNKIASNDNLVRSPDQDKKENDVSLTHHQEHLERGNDSQARKDTNFSLILTIRKGLSDADHPQYDRAFSRNIKPVYLLNWRPSPDSASFFQRIKGAESWLYSAYFVDCASRSVRLLGISNRDRNTLGPVYCHFLNEDKDKVIETTIGKLRALKDNHFLNFTAAIAECFLSTRIKPSYVTVTKSPDYIDSTNQIKIQYSGIKQRNFTVCYSPLHSKYNSTFKLIQSIELNRLLGADHFVFYNFSTSSQTDEILQFYKGQGLVTILPWPLPHLETWYYGQIAAINDCIYRNRIISQYVAVIDTDEFIIPNNRSNWLDLINDIIQTPSLREPKPPDSYYEPEGKRICSMSFDDNHTHSVDIRATKAPRFGSFMFRCSFFAPRPLSAHEEELVNSREFRLTSQQDAFFQSFYSEPLRYLKRSDFYDYIKRSKLIVNPETVISHAIHRTVQHVAGFTTAYVHSDAAYMHHYRPYKVGAIKILDLSTLRFKDEFYIRISEVVSKFPSMFPLRLK